MKNDMKTATEKLDKIVKQIAEARAINDNGHKVKGETPKAACHRCGGWTRYGGMSQHGLSTWPVLGRIGCICNRFHSM
nr:hypothetical protein [uncultured Mediterranean phage uvMED]